MKSETTSKETNSSQALRVLSLMKSVCIFTGIFDSAITIPDNRPLNRDEVACFLTPIYISSEKRRLISDYIKETLVAAFKSPLMKALDRSVEMLGL